MSDSYLPDNEPRDILWSLEELAARKLSHAPTFRKAAAEILRLRAENEKLRAALAEIGYDFSTNRDEAAIVARKVLR